MLNERWIRIIITQFWVFFTVALLAQVTIFLTNPFNDTFTRKVFFTQYVWMQDLIILTVIAASELVIRRFRSYTEHILVAGAIAIAATVVYSMPNDIHVGPIIMIFPILISSLTLKKLHLFSASLISIASATVNIAFFMELDYMGATRVFIVYSALIGSCLTGYGIIERGRELTYTLEKTTKSEQELLIRNVLMDRLTKVDPLTDLYNHKTFHEYMEKLVEHHRNNPYGLHLAVLDIDNFKKVNDTYGHAVGDIALKVVAERIYAFLGSDDFAARYGGEEFVVILTGGTIQDARAKMEHIRQSIAAATVEQMDNTSVTVSIGLHEYIAGETKESAFQKADSALYVAKRSGKNQTVIH
jgi:diguanylate cyclase (GGDEF)-like protein